AIVITGSDCCVHALKPLPLTDMQCQPEPPIPCLAMNNAICAIPPCLNGVSLEQRVRLVANGAFEFLNLHLALADGLYCLKCLGVLALDSAFRESSDTLTVAEAFYGL
ncbi:hypothetical protein, partial [Priestia megaterium]|uniref:hypothetical protein n=1 Tax=Priestia megaterium TaxID=1404 RepID=UPI0035B640CB